MQILFSACFFLQYVRQLRATICAHLFCLTSFYCGAVLCYSRLYSEMGPRTKQHHFILRYTPLLYTTSAAAWLLEFRIGKVINCSREMGGRKIFIQRSPYQPHSLPPPFSLCCSCIGTVLKNRTLLSISIKDPSCAIPPYHQFMAQTLGQKRYSAGSSMLSYTPPYLLF